jgi:hypothetical protein
MPLTTGVILFAFFTALGVIILSLTLGLVSMSFVGLIVMLYVLIFPYLFFIVVYNYPVQNLFFLPIPLPPICFGDDLLDSLVCDFIPKCPAVFAPLFKTAYTEANCYIFPLDPSLQPLSCREDLGMADIVDVVAFLIRWFFPTGPDIVRSILTSIPFIGPPIGDRFGKYAGLDLSDKATFDHFVVCAGYVGLWSIGSVLLLSSITAVLILGVGLIIFSIISKWILFLTVLFRLIYALELTLLVGTVFVVLPSHLHDFRHAMEVQAEIGDEHPKRRGLRRPAPPSAPPLAGSSTALFMASLSRFAGAARGIVWSAADRTGLDYYWQAAKKADKKTLEDLLVAKAERLNLHAQAKQQSQRQRREREERREHRRRTRRDAASEGNLPIPTAAIIFADDAPIRVQMEQDFADF